jgi:hypothetical protein
VTLHKPRCAWGCSAKWAGPRVLGLGFRVEP